MPHDPLSEILHLLNARCILSGGLAANEPWARHFGRPDAIKVMALVEGACWLSLDGAAGPIPLQTGDVILVNGRHAMTLASAPALLAEAPAPFGISASDDISRLEGDRDVFMLGGHVALDADRQDLLLDVLPPLIHIEAGAEPAKILHWLLEQLRHEILAQRPGAETAIGQLAQLVFVQALRAHLDTVPAGGTGWLAGLADPHVAAALRLMHQAPSHNWSLAELARQVGMSRSSFAARFNRLVGIAPLAYLTRWRIRLAEHRLRHANGVPIAALSRELGYSSESAFSNAFKRATGLAPMRYRAISRSSAAAIGNN